MYVLSFDIKIGVNCVSLTKINNNNLFSVCARARVLLPDIPFKTKNSDCLPTDRNW